jgi:hypothetical protein
MLTKTKEFLLNKFNTQVTSKRTLWLEVKISLGKLEYIHQKELACATPKVLQTSK